MGSSVKKVVKKVTKPIKKIVSSPVGQLGLAVFAPQFSFIKGAPNFITDALNRALVNAAATKLSGGDVDLKSSLIAGGIGAAVPNIPGISGIENPALQRAAIGSLTNVGTNLATGRDVNLQQAALAGGLSAGVGALQDRLSPPIDASKLEGITGGGEEDRFGGDYSEPIKGSAELEAPLFRRAALDATEAEGKGDFAEAEASRTVSQLSAAGDPVGLGGVPIGSVGDATQTASLADIGRSLMNRDISGAASNLADYVTDKQNAPKVLLGALTAAPLFFSPEQQEDETAAAFTQRRSDVTKFLRQYGSNFYSGDELDDFLSRTTSNLGYASGGRVSLAEGSKNKSGIMMASSVGDEGDEISMRLFGKPVKDLNEFELIDFYEELQRLQEKFRGAQGGRVGLAEGSGGFESAKDFIESTGDEELMDMYIDVLNGIKSEEALFKLLRKKGYQTYAVGGRVDYAEGSKDKSGIMMASAPDTMDSLNDLAQMLFGKNLDELTNDERDELDDYNRGLMAKGGMPTGIMKTNAAGIMERDYRETGGFVPVGIKEKADDVPAMLSKNEFVMTADAVRGAGNGSIEKGAQKMYDTMKELENRVA